MRFKQWPPFHYCWYQLNGILFEQQDNEPFVTYQNDEISTSEEANGFLNRIAKYGKANSLPEDSWSESKITKVILDHLPLSIRERFVDIVSELDEAYTPPTILHTAPIPANLLSSAQVPDILGLSKLTASQWIIALERWRTEYPEEANHKKLAGPVWWWAAHSVSLNYTDAAMPPNQFVVYWLSLFPCPHCRIKFETEWLRPNPAPEAWENFKSWISQAHDFVTSHKES